ncbi:MULTISPECIES: hypothetical protein [unclassified Bartonella]|uniref:hypothetical protein n=1 Tax=unclassified Bartonella TaxID=2645622 RepID=UPI0021C5A16C|nr:MULTISPECIES: hypothetical protein [unclassified Bartonella]UXN04476.1 hypothetical protein N6B01_05525 [Bartonella sp. HY406]UXN07470.1 hypothetical protein N6A79_05640 [Bartonella sp. HY761]
MKNSQSDLALIIAQEKKLVASETQAEAWANGMSNGIEPEILAEVAFVTALEHFLLFKKEEEALNLVDVIRERIIMGDFLNHKTVQ